MSGEPEPWLDAGAARWLEEARAWIGDVLRAHDLGPLEAVEEVKARPWSIVLRVTSRRALTWFKAAGRGGAHEPRLLTWLGERWPARVPALLGTHESRRWLLMADAGTPLREAGGRSEALAVLKRLLPSYAELQIASAGEVEALLALGLPDRRVGHLPDLLRALLSGRSDAGTRYAALLDELAPAIAGRLPSLERCCAELAEAARASALDHGDLHGANVVVRDREGRLCDWGDASVTHPFCSLLPTLQMTLGDAAEPERAALACELRDAYLEPWTELAPLEALRSELDRALWVAHVVRVLDWTHALRGADAASFARWSPHVAQDVSRWLAHHELLGSGGSPQWR